jgi:ankyrin repeat protein
MTTHDVEVTALFAAIRDGRLDDAADALTRDPTLVNSRDADGGTPLHEAAFYNDARMAALLVLRGADPRATYGESGHTPLSWAVTCRSLDFANALVRLGVEPDFFCAAGMGALDRVESWFEESGALKPNASTTGSSRLAPDGTRLPCPPPTAIEQISDALYIACRNAHAPVVRFLLTKNPDLAFRAYAGGTPLHWAHFSGSREVIAVLMNADADDTLRDDRLGVRPRAFGICTPASWGFADLVRRHLDRDPSLARVFDGTSPLHEAARGGHRDIMRMLLEAGADPAVPDRDGKLADELMPGTPPGTGSS